MQKLDHITAGQLRDDVPDFRAGDTVKVHVKVVEGNRSRIQVFQGVVIGRQGQGIGSRLLNEAKRRRKSLQLTVYKANHASVGFYQKQGFRVTAEQVDEHTGHAELCMRYDTQGE